MSGLEESYRKARESIVQPRMMTIDPPLVEATTPGMGEPARCVDGTADAANTQLFYLRYYCGTRDTIGVAWGTRDNTSDHRFNFGHVSAVLELPFDVEPTEADREACLRFLAPWGAR